MPELVGTDVEWIEGLGPYRFSREVYEQCLAAFRTMKLVNEQ